MEKYGIISLKVIIIYIYIKRKKVNTILLRMKIVLFVDYFNGKYIFFEREVKYE